MIDSTIKYMGYQGTVEYSAEDNLLYGKVIGINGLISYEGEDLSTLKQCFVESINDYLAQCEAEGIPPMRPAYGKIDNINISPELHRDFELFFVKRNKKISEALEEAIKQYIAV